MFSRSQSSSRTDRPRDAAATAAPSIISADMRVSGDLRTDGDIQVDGVVDGDIQSSSISVGRTAEINGEIVAGTVRVWGRVNGRIRGRDISLMETACVVGDVVHETLEIARGAQVEGMLKRQPLDEPKQPKVNLVVAAGEPVAGADKAAAPPQRTAN